MDEDAQGSNEVNEEGAHNEGSDEQPGEAHENGEMQDEQSGEAHESSEMQDEHKRKQ